jgi:hypothetical protein
MPGEKVSVHGEAVRGGGGFEPDDTALVGNAVEDDPQDLQVGRYAVAFLQLLQVPLAVGLQFLAPEQIGLTPDGLVEVLFGFLPLLSGGLGGPLLRLGHQGCRAPFRKVEGFLEKGVRRHPHVPSRARVAARASRLQGPFQFLVGGLQIVGVEDHREELLVTLQSGQGQPEVDAGQSAVEHLAAFQFEGAVDSAQLLGKPPARGSRWVKTLLGHGGCPLQDLLHGGEDRGAGGHQLGVGVGSQEVPVETEHPAGAPGPALQLGRQFHAPQIRLQLPQRAAVEPGEVSAKGLHLRDLHFR